MSVNIEDIVELVRRVDLDPEDLEAKAVLADWAEEKDILEGRRGEGITKVCPLPVQTIPAGQAQTIDSQIFSRRFRLRTIYVPQSMSSLLAIADVIIDSNGNVLDSIFERSPFYDAGTTIPAELFDSRMLLFDRIIERGRRLSLRVVNNSGGAITFSGALLGS